MLESHGATWREIRRRRRSHAIFNYTIFYKFSKYIRNLVKIFTILPSCQNLVGFILVALTRWTSVGSKSPTGLPSRLQSNTARSTAQTRQ